MILRLILAILLLPSLLYAGQGCGPGPGFAMPAAASCETVEQSATVGTSATTVGNGTNLKLSHSFLASSTYNLCKAIYKMAKTGSPTFDIAVELWSDNGSAVPNAKIGDLGTINAAGLASDAAPEDETFTIASPIALTSGVRYHVIFSAATGGDVSNYVRVYRSTSGTEKLYFWTGASWGTAIDGSSTLYYYHYK